MKTLTELIQNYQNGIPDSDSEILKRMEPLVKGYASRIHCMEREDSTQELYLTLLKTLPYLSSSSSEGECIRYMQTSVENRYRSLCRSCLSEPEKDDFDSCSVSLQAPDSFDDTYYDVTAYINSYPSDSVQRKMNNPVPVSLLSGDRKPQIRFLGNHPSGSGNLYHKSFRM